MIKLFKYLKPFTISIILILILTYIQTMADLALPDYMSKIVDEGVINGDTSYIIKVGLQMLGVAFISIAATIIVCFLAAQVGSKFGRNIRHNVFTKVEGFSLNEFNRFSTASLITRSTNDVQQIQIFLIIFLRMVLSAPIMGLGGVLKVINMDSSMAWIIALAVSILLTVIVVLVVIALPKFNIVQQLIDKLNLVVRERLNGLLVIRAFNKEKAEEKRFDKANVDLMKVNLFIGKIMILLMPIMSLVMNLTTVLILWVGANQIADNAMQVGDLMAFIQYTIRIIMSFLMLAMMFIFLPRATVSAKRIAEVLNTEAIIKDNENSISKIKNIGHIEFRNVSFRYPDADENIISNISFSIEAGSTTAFIGSTGSGKSTIIDLIPRFYDVTDGSILLDGIDIRDIKQSVLRSKIGYVPQKGILFSGTIKSNIKYGNTKLNNEELENVSKIAQAFKFIDEKEDKFNSEIAQGGTNISGGQKQRLAIARAIAKKPLIYIFDDSFSALDFKTDQNLRKALKKETEDKTVIIVAQRIGTILNADKIIVLEDGEIVGVGNHNELMKTCNVYQEIASSQLSKEELQ